MKQNKFTIAANWKMNPLTKKSALALFAVYVRLAKQQTKLNFVCAVPTMYLELIASKKRPHNVLVCAQNVYHEDSGSYTGETSIPMLTDAGVDMVMIGHSERRTLFGDTNEVVGKKVAHTLEKGIPMIVCFGETVRDVNGTYAEELEAQLRAITTPFKKSKKINLLQVAYEPVWAIGAQSKRAITEDELFSTLLLIRNILGKQLGVAQAKKINIWYGGSVSSDNAHSLAQVPGIKGFLVGRAGLDKESITSIVKQVASN